MSLIYVYTNIYESKFNFLEFMYFNSIKIYTKIFYCLHVDLFYSPPETNHIFIITIVTNHISFLQV